MIRFLKILFSIIFVSMLIVTTWASLEKNVGIGFAAVWAERWGIATLADAGFGFLTFCVWLCYRERGWASRVLWVVAVFLLGNIAMSFYVLRILFRLKPGEGAAEILLRPAV